MATDDEIARLYNKKILPFDQFKGKFLDYLVNNMRQLHADFYRDDGLFAAATITADGNNLIKIATAVEGVTGSGRRIKVPALDPRLDSVRLPPGAAVLYNVAIEASDVEAGIETNPRTGEFEYRLHREEIGRKAHPTTVVNNGDGTLTITVTSVLESGVDWTGRLIRVWMTSRTDGGNGPLSPVEADAIRTIAVVDNAGTPRITVPNLMGQNPAAVSTIQADYWVMAVGPTVLRVATENLQNTVGALFIGDVTSVAASNPPTVFDHTAQKIVTNFTHQEITRYWPPSAAMSVTGQTATYVYAWEGSGYHTGGGSETFFEFPVTPTLRPGDRIKSIVIRVKEPNASGEQPEARFLRQSPTTVEALPTQIGAQRTSGLTNAAADMSWTIANEAAFGAQGYTLGNFNYIVAIRIPSGQEVADSYIISMSITYDHPV